MPEPREAYSAVDTDGRTITLVPLAQPGHVAKLFPEDFDVIVSEGFSSQWLLNDNGEGHRFVRCHSRRRPGERRGNMITLARVITRARRGTVVTYRDGDRLNLRRDNLEIGRGMSKGREVAMLGSPMGAPAVL